jgi:hypothetical protein
MNEPFLAFQMRVGSFSQSGGSMSIDGLVYPLVMRLKACANSVSLSLLGQAVITSILAWLFLDEKYDYWWS